MVYKSQENPKLGQRFQKVTFKIIVQALSLPTNLV